MSAFGLAPGQRVLVVATHPDDETLGCGGTIARLVADGVRVHALAITVRATPLWAGESNPATRLREFTAACDALGVIRRAVAWVDHTGAVDIATVEDRIVHRALRRCVEPILEAHAYPAWMFGWRPGQGRIHAQHQGITSPCWVADIDIAHATAGGTVEQAVGWLAQWIPDGCFLATVRHALEGLPSPLAPGSGLTPLLTNLRLLRIDHTLTEITVVRVTDSYVIFCTGRHEAQRAFDHLAQVLSPSALQPNPAKSKIWRPNLEDLFLAG